MSDSQLAPERTATLRVDEILGGMRASPADYEVGGTGGWQPRIIYADRLTASGR